MRTNGLHEGDFRKYITVTCNAKNTPSFRISLGGVFIPLVQVTPTVVRFTTKGKDTSNVLTIKARRKDLKISEVIFRETGKDADWKSSVPISFSLAMEDSSAARVNNPTTAPDSGKANLDSTTAAGKMPSYTYKLKLSCTPGEKETKYGDIIIKTNVPEKAEIKISGVIEVKKG